MLARPEVPSCEYAFAGSISLVLASGADDGEEREIKDALAWVKARGITRALMGGRPASK